jgi:hypothetical protein
VDYIESSCTARYLRSGSLVLHPNDGIGGVNKDLPLPGSDILGSLNNSAEESGGHVMLVGQLVGEIIPETVDHEAAGGGVVEGTVVLLFLPVRDDVVPDLRSDVLLVGPSVRGNVNDGGEDVSLDVKDLLLLVNIEEEGLHVCII